MNCTVKLNISRAGNNIFVVGLNGRHGTVHIVSALTKKDRAIDTRGRAYLEVNYPEKGENPKKISVLINSKNQLLELIQLQDGQSKTVKIDPWKYI